MGFQKFDAMRPRLVRELYTRSTVIDAYCHRYISLSAARFPPPHKSTSRAAHGLWFPLTRCIRHYTAPSAFRTRLDCQIVGHDEVLHPRTCKSAEAAPSSSASWKPSEEAACAVDWTIRRFSDKHPRRNMMMKERGVTQPCTIQTRKTDSGAHERVSLGA